MGLVFNRIVVMRFIFIIFFNFIFVFTASPQSRSELSSNNTPIGKITYTYKSYQLNGGFIERDAVLLFNEDKSLFYHSRGKAPAFFVNDINCMDGCYEVDEIGKLFLKDFDKDTLHLREIALYQAYISGESIPDLGWDISSEIKQIGRFSCQKATAKFRGRKYTAWFTPDIPISDGPWKFSGLPGMILQVSSDDNQYAFLYKSIEMPVNDKDVEQINFSNKGLKVDFETFVKADELEFEKAKKKSEANWLSSGGEPGGFKMKRTVPDPIELHYDDRKN